MLPVQSVFVPQGNGFESASWGGVNITLLADPVDFVAFENNNHRAYLFVIPNSSFVEHGFPIIYTADYQGEYTETFIYTPVPEPVSSVLLAVGLGAIFAARTWREAGL